MTNPQNFKQYMDSLFQSLKLPVPFIKVKANVNKKFMPEEKPFKNRFSSVCLSMEVYD